MENKLDDFESWKYRRCLAYMNYCFAAYVFGASLSIYFQTEYFYFKDTMKVSNPQLFYGLSTAAICSSGVISSLAISYYADKSRNLRKICITATLLMMLGNTLYTLYYSPYLILISQILVGTNAARVVAAIGEISRMFSEDILTFRISILTIFSSVGGLSGPCLTYLFKLVDIHLGNWDIMINNMPGIYMVCLALIQLCLDVFILTNVSKDYQNLPKKQQLGNLLLKTQVRDLATFRKQYTQALKSILRNRSITVLLLLVFFMNYTRSILTLLQPIKFDEFLNWKQTDLALFLLMTILTAALPSSIILPLATKYVKDFYILLYSIFMLLLAILTIILLSYFHTNSLLMKVFAYGNGIFCLMNQVPFHVVARCILLQFVPVQIRTITDALRNTIFELSYVVAGATFKLAAMYTKVFLFLLTFVNIAFVSWLIYDRSSYLNINVIESPSCEMDEEEQVELLEE